MKNGYNLGLTIKRQLIYVFLVFLTLMVVFPIWTMIVNGTRTIEEVNGGLSLIPGTNLVNNWNRLIFGAVGTAGANFDIGVGFMNSFIIAFSATALSIYFSTLTAYGFYMYVFRGRSVLFSVVLGMIMIPTQLGLIGFYKYIINVGLRDNFLPLILPAIAAPSTVFFMRQYIQTVVHKDLIDAARIDGCGEFRAFNQIALPVLSPGMATMAIFTFVGVWNNFITPYILLTSRSNYTLPMFVQLLRTDVYRTDVGALYLGITVSVVPLIIFYLIMSKYIISGLTLGSIKE